MKNRNVGDLFYPERRKIFGALLGGARVRQIHVSLLRAVYADMPTGLKHRQTTGEKLMAVNEIGHLRLRRNIHRNIKTITTEVTTEMNILEYPRPRRVPSSGMLRHVGRERGDDSEEPGASIIRVIRISGFGTTLA
jgi:hypothetical protein